MTTARFNATTMAAASETYPPVSDTGNRPPRVHFELRHPDVMTADPPGAYIRCEVEGPRKSRVTIKEERQPGGYMEARAHIADITVHATGTDDLTTETIAIASSIYWSWWRARDMKGEAPR